MIYIHSDEQNKTNLFAWGASAFTGVLAYLKLFPMQYHILSLDWQHIFEWLILGGQLVKVLAVAAITGYVGSWGSSLGKKHFNKYINKKKK